MRHDHTKWLTHFVRDRKPEQDFPGADEDEAGCFIGGELEMDSSAFDVLKAIVRLGGLLPGHSFRSGSTTIYGGEPVVCATEMPIYSFADYAHSKKDPSKVSAYGIAFLKSEFFAAGGRPAIYGLSISNPTYVTKTATRRIFTDSVLPKTEQFRYVAYNPSPSNWIDWSHEREWRWQARDESQDEIWCQDYNGSLGPVPALPLFKGEIDGRSFTRVCIIVWSHEEAKEIRELLTGFYLAGHNNYDTPFDKKLIAASKIIVLQDVVAAVEAGKNLGSQTIEGLEAANLLSPIAIVPAPPDAKEVAEKAMSLATAAGKKAADEYLAKYDIEKGSCGFANAVTYDVTSPMVQYLLTAGMASGPFDGAVWIDFPHSWPPSQSIDYREAICRAAAEALSKALGISVYMDSRLD